MVWYYDYVGLIREENREFNGIVIWNSLIAASVEK
jgi:hypothetical protein